MVHLETLNIMRAHIKENWQEYVKSHPGEYVLLEQDYPKPKETFFRTKGDLENALATYEGQFGPTFVSEHIPKRSHKYTPGNRFCYFSPNQHLKVCPNDNKTRLKGTGAIIYNSQAKNGTEYTEEAYCPDCSCRVFRRPTEKAIAESKKRMNRMVFR